MNLNNLFEGAIDDLEKRRIEDLEMKMDDLAARAKESKDPKVIAALRQEFAKAKAERDSYHYVNEHGGGGGGPAQWHAYVKSHRTDEGAGSDKDTIVKVMDKVFVDGGGGNLSYMLELKAPTLDALRDKYHDDLDAMFAHASKEELAQAAQELRDMYSQVDEAAVNPQFINAQVTKILAGEVRRMTNAPIAQLLAPVMKEYNLTLQQIDSMVPGGLKKAAGEYGIMMKEGFQDFNKVEPYAVCLAGKPVKQFDYYEEARRFHDNWKKKLYNQGEKEKADKITLMPLNLDEGFGSALTRAGKYVTGASRVDQAIKNHETQRHLAQQRGDHDAYSRANAKGSRIADRFYNDDVEEGYHANTIDAMTKAAPTFKVGDAMWTRDENGRPVSGEVVELRPGSVVFKTEDGRRFRAPEGRVMKRVHEGSMADASHHETGPKFSGYYKGTQIGAPKPGQSFGAESKEMDEGAKVDRMVKHITKSEKATGKSAKDAESIAWATANKRGMLDNANKKDESMNFMEWAVSQGSRFNNFASNPEVYAQAKEAYVAEGMSNALSNITRRIAQPVSANTIIKNREQKKKTIKTQNFAEGEVDENIGSLVTGATELWNVINLIKEYGLPIGLFAAAVGMYGLSKAAEYLEQGDDKFAQMAKLAVKKIPPETIHKITDKLNQAFAKITSKEHNPNPMASAMDFTEEKQKGVDGKACWDGYKRMGTKQKGGKTVDNCVKMGEMDKSAGQPGRDGHISNKTYGTRDNDVISGKERKGTPVKAKDFAKDIEQMLKKHSIDEDWQKANKKDKTDGMSQKAVNAYKRENPGSKLKTAVTTKPSKLKKGSKDSKRRSSYCARSKGQKDMHNIDCSKTPDKAICKARKRWNCESQEQFDAMLREATEKSDLQPGQYYVWTVYFDDGTNKRVKVTKDTFDPKAYYAKQNKVVVNVDYDWTPKNG